MRQPKIVIVGAGLVGGSAALFAAVAIPSAQIVIIDLERVRAEGQALDLAHATAFWGHDRVRAGDDADARDADIVVVTAGAGVKPGQTRLDLVQTNAHILGEILDRIAPLAPEAIWVIATNPCDPLAHVAQARLRGPSAPAPRSTPRGCAPCCPRAWAWSRRPSTPTCWASMASRR
jgi:L-lactate dehydrogenase